MTAARSDLATIFARCFSPFEIVRLAELFAEAEALAAAQGAREAQTEALAVLDILRAAQGARAQ